jgi:hypothetical protein
MLGLARSVLSASSMRWMRKLSLIVGLMACSVGCSGIEGTEATDDAEDSAGAVSAGKPRELSAKEAVALHRRVLESAIEEYTKKYPDRPLGQGWFGNMTGCGDKCNVVHDRFTSIVERLFRKEIKAKNCIVPTHDLVTRVASGTLRVEALSGHVYIALVDIREKTTKDEVVFDPWRNQKAFYDEDPNSGAKEDVRWLMDRIRPTQD